MRLKVLLPASVLVDEDAVRIVAEAEDGSFGVLPRHIDFLSALKPGVLVFEMRGGGERFVGHDLGIFVKRGSEVLVSTRKAVLGTDLAALRETIEREFKTLDERSRAARTALARLEAGVVRRFMELEERR
ncbi:MAG: F0F1 ATP synthase subunit epsilon [Hyphomicrobiales bacterium]|nr:F0F1 ATP synthase subunit epsilon [Hyphomicrobiales bacterium]